MDAIAGRGRAVSLRRNARRGLLGVQLGEPDGGVKTAQDLHAFLLELQLRLLVPRHLLGQRLQVDASGVASHRHAAVDEALNGDLLLVVLLARGDEVEEARRILDIQPQHRELLTKLPGFDLVLEFVSAQRAALVRVHHLHDVPQLLKLGQIVGELLISLGLLVRPRQLHGVLHENCSEDVQQSNLAEGDEEDEQTTVQKARLLDDLEEHIPVVAARRGLVQRQDGSLYPSKLAEEQVDHHRVLVALQVRVDQVVRHALDEDQPEDVEDEYQHADAPEQRRQGAGERVEHQAQLGEDLHDPQPS
mmetsp:Transcript_29308/g.74544  ORF Transcript_29308/g.74544 Transcript_29308/m.74544 type:complete len:304 (+) Transcript_29308:366-1277(+)